MITPLSTALKCLDYPSISQADGISKGWKDNYFSRHELYGGADKESMESENALLTKFMAITFPAALGRVPCYNFNARLFVRSSSSKAPLFY